MLAQYEESPRVLLQYYIKPDVVVHPSTQAVVTEESEAQSLSATQQNQGRPELQETLSQRRKKDIIHLSFGEVKPLLFTFDTKHILKAL